MSYEKEIQRLTTMNNQLEAGLEEAYRSGNTVFEAFKRLQKKVAEQDEELQKLRGDKWKS
jgi:hypothetical protein